MSEKKIYQVTQRNGSRGIEDRPEMGFKSEDADPRLAEWHKHEKR